MRLVHAAERIFPSAVMRVSGSIHIPPMIWVRSKPAAVSRTYSSGVVLAAGGEVTTVRISTVAALLLSWERITARTVSEPAGNRNDAAGAAERGDSTTQSTGAAPAEGVDVMSEYWNPYDRESNASS